MAHGRPRSAWSIACVRADGPVRLELTPLCTWRNVHGERLAGARPSVEVTADGFVFEGAYRAGGTGLGARRRLVSRRALAGGGRPRARRPRGRLGGRAASARRWSPGRRWRSPRPPRRSTAPLPRAADLVRGAKARADDLAGSARPTDAVDRQLVLAADQFVIEAPGVPTVVAGYPWFGEWSRDAMTAYEGLFLATNRWDEGREALRRAAATVSEGMLANTADTGTLEYNTADGTLWFVHALGRHLDVTGDDDLGAELAPVVRSDRREPRRRHALRHRCRPGRRPAARRAPTAGRSTWMDARIDGRPVTPRAGKAVEVNALWVEALAVAQRLLAQTPFGERCAALARCRRPAPFRRALRAERRGRPPGRGRRAGGTTIGRCGPISCSPCRFPTRRSLGGGCRRRARGRRRLRRSLLTPLGLRSLSPDDPDTGRAIAGLGRAR